MRRVTRAAGIADPEPGARVITEGFAQLARTMHDVAGYFGEEANLQLLRVLGSAMARIADTTVSLFLVNVEPVARQEDPVGLGVARANVRGADLVPLMAPVLDALFRQHLLSAQRPMGLDEGAGGYETRLLAVGFVDLVGSTELGEQLSMSDLGALLTRFEHLAADTVTVGGGRVVKLLGDEVLFAAPDAATACDIALGLAAAVAADPGLPGTRGGVAHGPVMLRDGDVFGPIVNLAARLVAAAEPGEVLVTADLVGAAGRQGEPRGRRQLKGIGPVDVVRLRPG